MDWVSDALRDIPYIRYKLPHLTCRQRKRVIDSAPSESNVICFSINEAPNAVAVAAAHEPIE